MKFEDFIEANAWRSRARDAAWFAHMAWRADHDGNPPHLEKSQYEVDHEVDMTLMLELAEFYLDKCRSNDALRCGATMPMPSEQIAIVLKSEIEHVAACILQVDPGLARAAAE